VSHLKPPQKFFCLAFERASAVRVARVEKGDPGVYRGVVRGLQLAVVGLVVTPQQLSTTRHVRTEEVSKVGDRKLGCGCRMLTPSGLRDASPG
jgi:hypothetical protein